MIDEDWLHQALEEVASAIEVPVDGPERVLAARDERARARPPSGFRARRPSRRTVIVGAAMAVVIGAVAFAVIGDHHNSGHQEAQRPTRPAFIGPSGAGFGTAEGGAGGTATGQAIAGSVSAGTSAPALSPIPRPPALPSRVVKTGDVQLRVQRGQLASAVNQLTSMSGGFGGYVADTKSSEGSNTPTADITLEVPVDQFDAALTRTRSLGKPISVSTTSKDVTAEYVDLDARIHSLQVTRDQFLQILAKATTIGDILAVQQQLSGVQTQLEELQGQQRVLDNQTKFSTLAIHVSEPGSSVSTSSNSPSGLSKAWSHARHSVTHGLEAVVAESGGFAVFTFWVLALLLIGRFGWSVIRRRLV
ncbi:MAG TPA: DUF4349 domain-containing protein [Acidimicrobiales bacterium]